VIWRALPARRERQVHQGARPLVGLRTWGPVEPLQSIGMSCRVALLLASVAACGPPGTTSVLIEVEAPELSVKTLSLTVALGRAVDV
jgi:hypothetical protein